MVDVERAYFGAEGSERGRNEELPITQALLRHLRRILLTDFIEIERRQWDPRYR